MEKKSVKVLYDCQIFNMQNYGGISKHFAVYIKEFGNKNIGVIPLLGGKFCNNYHISNLFPNQFINFPNIFLVSGLAEKLNFLSTKQLSNKADIFHPTYYFPEYRVVNPRLPMVTTVHDMIPEILPHLFPGGNPHKSKKDYCFNSDVIISISKSTRDDLLKIYKLPRERIKILYPGINYNRSQTEISKMPDLPSNYILYVGKREKYKNFSLLIAAMKKVKKYYPEVNIVCVGGGPLQQPEKNMIKLAGLLKSTYCINANDRQLRYIYRKAKALVFPSIYEGFGLPIIEAFAQRCPAVLLSTPIFHEIADDAALYFDNNIESCSYAISKALTDNLAKIIAIGECRCKDFSSQESAKRLAKIYKTLSKK
jgi:glycosyltransferase involved in cell wall biosynthesis